MNKIKQLTVASLIVFASSMQTAQVANAHDLSSGVNCMAANLTQALAGMGWSQAGVKNNASSSFFVVCPMDRDFDDILPINAVVWTTHPAGGSTIECTLRQQNVAGGAYTTTAITITTATDRGSQFQPVTINALQDGNSTIVCALDPGEGIELNYFI